ncbi:hypothetical protein FSP39_022476 [Pinctada imbricata]|uniref:Carrier domain-containing protein n=1 Tax=Pinctada imbricata TaxID=66713 RepID=A0AA88YFK3_PINIB|nr:hypothetical protein FSP39_022476 [Pinctada imbricata]
MADYADQGLLHEMFSRQAKATPDRVAIVEEKGRQILYKDLDTESDILARYLQFKGVTLDSCVGIYLQKSIEFSTAYIAILKAGGAYLQLDVSYPEQLLLSIVKDAQPKAIVTSQEFAENIKEAHENIIILNDGWQKRLAEETAKFKFNSLKISLDNLAYIVYSSGTTGKPKGIMCPHRGAVFSFHHRHSYFPYQDDDREACNIFFTWEMLRPLLKGQPMYIIPNTVIYDPPLLCNFIKDNTITRMLFTPSLLEAVLNVSGLDFATTLKSLRQIWFCGEVVTTALMERCMKMLPWIRFINLYSVSECHDVACEDLSEYFKSNKDALSSRKFCPVGRLLPGVHVVILNEESASQPVGASGEIYVGGPTLARGYLNRPDLDALRFISRPPGVQATCGERLYRTGDWGYMLSDGSLEICGRCDTMVKIRGYSIEVQAVETALMELDMVNAAVVLVKGEEGEDKFLVSYIVPEGQITRKHIREALKRRLPYYMIPSYFVLLSSPECHNHLVFYSIPIVQTTGKLDKSALPPFDKQSESEVDAESRPSTETEKTIAGIWAKVLQIKDIDIHESFFDLGGHSLLATEMLILLRKTYSVDIAVKDLFMYPTIHSVSRFIEAKSSKSSDVIVEKEPEINLLEEVDKYDQGKISIDMQLRAFWRIFNLGNQSRFKTARVLLTGATGFLGAFILKKLLLRTKTLIYCLARELPEKSALARVEDNLRQFGILATKTTTPTEEQSIVSQLLQKRVHVVKGDVALINLGMNEEDFTYLSTDIDYIIHAAAAVNLAYPYQALKGSNVQGTANVAMFACTGKIKPIHFISTDAVFPNGLTDCTEDDDVTDFHHRLEDGYSKSKWVAEQLISRAGRRGIPVTIYRLGNMAGDSKMGHWNPQDFTLMMLRACSKYGLAPDVDWHMEMTPVDFAAEFIVKMTHHLQQGLGKIFHVINDRPLSSRMIFEWMNAHGYPLEILPFKEWKERILKEITNAGNEQEENQLMRILESYASDANFLEDLSTFKADNLHQILPDLGMSYPYIDNSILKFYFHQLNTRQIISMRRSRHHAVGSRLEGKVAIVTGASSGIGKAIATALALEGAKVAMAARRLERLQEHQKQIEAQGGVVTCIKTDVTNRNEVKELVRQTESILGPVDILVNNAGIMYYTMMKNCREDEWDKQIDLNVKGFPGLVVYSGTKFYVEGLSQALRQEVCGLGIRVTNLQPGDVRTELFIHTTDKEAQDAYDGSQKCKILEPEDIANAVLYAVTQPEYVGVHEILIEPREAPL